MSSRTRILSDGLIVALIGYAIVVLLVSVLDMLQGRSPFYTAALLGSASFYGLEDPAELRVWAGPVLAWNGAHLLVFLLTGTFMAWLVDLSERGPHLWYLNMMVFFFVIAHVIGLPVWFSDAVRGQLSLWTVTAGVVAAVAGMSSYLWKTHPALRALEVSD